ncbi:sensor histidine kinase [Leucobacter sp. HY1910]
MTMVTQLPGAPGASRLGPAAATARAMRVGQHAIAVGLTAIGVVRAIGDGTDIAAALAAGIAVLAWHTAGALLPARAPRAVTIWWLVGFAAVWGAAVAVSAEFVWLAFLLWLLAGHLLPGWWALAFSALVYTIVAVAPVLHHGHTSYANIFGPLIGGVFALGISRGYLQLLRDAAEREALVESLTQARHETELLQDELALAQRQSGAMGERARIARDVHDTVAQGLSSIRLIAHAASSVSVPRGETPPGPLEQIEQLAGESLRDVRRIIAALTPAELETGALAGALERMIDRFAHEHGTEADDTGGAAAGTVGGAGSPAAAEPQARLHVDEALPQLPVDIEVALLRVAQSALANVRQHARAARVDVTLSAAGGEVRLDVRDDGVGFDPELEPAPRAGESSSFGLRLMRERLRDLGGGLDIESAPGEGCAISAYLPLGATREATKENTQ